jgi:hypothetical protein
MALWEKHKYARIEIPEEDAEEIRTALLKALGIGANKFTDRQKRLLARLHNCLGEIEVVTHAGKAGW